MSDFDLLATERRGAARPPARCARGGRDAGLHAGRHLRHGQGHDARGTRRASAREIILGNTFHLMLRPGTDVIRAHGGLHGFMHWPRPDPHRLRRLPGLQPRGAAQAHGGGRAVPLARRRRRGVPHARGLDGGAGRARLRHRHGASTTARRTRPPRQQARESMERSMRWARAQPRRIRRTSATRNALFGIVQGGMHLPLRLESARGAARHRLRRLRRSAASRSASRTRSATAVLEALEPHLPARPAALPHGRRHAGRHRRRPCRAASTCSTA